MGELSEIFKGINLPKQLIDKGEQLVKSVFGPSVKEISETFGDSFRLRRFKNQVDILTKAQKYINDSGITPKNIDLKVLAPLIHYSSLEENIDLQERWAKLIVNVVKSEGNTLLKQNAIEIISKISSQEARFLEYLFDFFKQKRINRVEYFNNEDSSNPKNIEDFPLHWFSCTLTEILKTEKLSLTELELMVSNLVALGVVRWEIEVDIIEARKNDISPYDLQLDIDLDVNDTYAIKLTSLGFEFVNICRLE